MRVPHAKKRVGRPYCERHAPGMPAKAGSVPPDCAAGGLAAENLTGIRVGWDKAIWFLMDHLAMRSSGMQAVSV